jgi:hypothetical protein
VLRSPSDLHLDCLGVLNVLGKPRDKQLSGRSQHAGYIRSSLGESGRKNVSSLSKVKAHQSLVDSGLSEVELARARGNDAADRAAKLGASKHRTPARELLDKADCLVARAREVLTLAARLLPHWPASTGPRAERGRPSMVSGPPDLGAETGATAGARPIRRHAWSPYRGIWHCRLCSAMAHSDSRKEKRSSEVCPGFNAWFRSLLLDPRGHKLAIGDASDLALIACVSCGCWATTKPVGLLQPCQGFPTQAGKQALGFLEKGFHPVSRIPLCALWSLAEASLLAENAETAESSAPEGSGVGGPPIEAPRPPAGGARGGPSAQERLAALRARVLLRAQGPE